MNKKILAFGASNSTQSINRKLANYVANQVKESIITLLDLNDFEMPIYSIDREKENGIPDLAKHFKEIIKSSDGIVISFAEHNGAYSAAFKNIFDWVSRIEKDIWANKPMFLLATSPGKRGGKSVLEMASTRFKFMNQNTIVSFSLPSFHENFSEDEGITDESLKHQFILQLSTFIKAVHFQEN